MCCCLCFILFCIKNIRENTKEMPQSRSTVLPRHQKEGDIEGTNEESQQRNRLGTVNRKTTVTDFLFRYVLFVIVRQQVSERSFSVYAYTIIKCICPLNPSGERDSVDSVSYMEWWRRILIRLLGDFSERTWHNIHFARRDSYANHYENTPI